MKTTEMRSARSSHRSRLAGLGAPGLVGLVGLACLSADTGCLTRPLEPIDTRTTWTAHFKQIKSGVNRIDLLLMLDNSSSMADKQAILAEAVPDLVRGLLGPPCVGNDAKPVANQPASPSDACPAGSAREFEPVLDVHIGIVTSSLGGHGSSTCKYNPKASITSYNNPTLDDHGHLISRADASTPDKALPTYKSQGFLAWDPKQALTPPGEKSLDTTVEKLREMVHGLGEEGCGYESQLESWYRFLIDPEPYQSIALDAKSNVVITGLDQALLDERAAFLRPDSLVAVLMLTDENDCSTREDRFFPVSNDLNYRMPRARQECAKSPDDPCCAPCGFAPAHCSKDAMCDKPTLDPAEDPINLRCFDQKRRYGIDFLYPTDRYTHALLSAQIPRRDGQLVDNPLYPRDPDGTLNARSPETGLVFVAGIVGVPWQDLARQRADGTPDLLFGLDDKGKPSGGFKSASELQARDEKTHGSRWDVILGDPGRGVAPLDPLMIESRVPRTGKNPITGDVLAPPGTSSAGQNAINGHEWNTDASAQNGVSFGDLEYACVFDLKAQDQRDCGTSTGACDCAQADTDGSDNPLCQSPSTGAYGKLQRRAKGYPGVRELEVLKGVGEQGIVASICPAPELDTLARDYGYSPAIGALIDRLKHKLSGQCLTRPLTPKSDGKVSCVVVEARKSVGAAACCDGKARRPVAPEHAEALSEAKADRATAGDDCFCEIEQLGGADLQTCRTDTDLVPVSKGNTPVDGWCYVDQSTGAPSLVDACPSGEKFKVRFVGAGQPGSDAVTFITCAGGN